MPRFSIFALLARSAPKFQRVTNENFFRYLAVVVTACLWFYLPLPEYQGHFREHPSFGWGILSILSLAWYWGLATLLGLTETMTNIAGQDFLFKKDDDTPDFCQVFENAFVAGKGTCLDFFLLTNALEVFQYLWNTHKDAIPALIQKHLAPNHLLSFFLNQLRGAKEAGEREFGIVLLILEQGIAFSDDNLFYVLQLSYKAGEDQKTRLRTKVLQLAGREKYEAWIRRTEGSEVGEQPALEKDILPSHQDKVPLLCPDSALIPNESSRTPRFLQHLKDRFFR